MLSGDFYTIDGLHTEEQTIRATLIINSGHRIFEGHFPGFPVVPGVCMMQIIKELLEEITLKKTRLIRADHAKFLSVINPLDQPRIEAEIKYHFKENGEIWVTAILFKEKTIFLKYQAVFNPLGG
jgi:3-hydroxyacyl-[acyl-carrier-protein] dehydratase